MPSTQLYKEREVTAYRAVRGRQVLYLFDHFFKTSGVALGAGAISALIIASALTLFPSVHVSLILFVLIQAYQKGSATG